jgi:hypothetical protein
MSKALDRLSSRMEIEWSACERCGALGPQIGHSRRATRLRGLCCHLSEMHDSAHVAHDEFVTQMDLRVETDVS